MTASELKERIAIERVVEYYGGSINGKGVGRCLLAQNHRHGDRHPSMTVRRGRVKCWSQGCFGEKGADVFQLVGIMENLPSFADQKRRVAEVAGLVNEGSLHRPSVPPPRIDLRETASRFQLYSEMLWLRAQSVLAAAKGLDVAQWSHEEVNTAMAAVWQAYEDFARSELFADVAFRLRRRCLEQEKVKHAA